MPIYKGSTEVTSGNLRKGSTNIENGYKETSPFYTNTNGITINFIDAISGATMSTTQFSSVGVPGASFSSFSRTITVDSGRTFSTNPTVSESGDSGNNVTTSISSQTSTSAVLNVSGTYPTSGTTVTLTINGATQVQLPNLVVTQNSQYPLTTTGDGGPLGTYNYSISNSADCVGGSSGSGSTSASGSSSSDTYYSYSRPGLAGGPYGNGCGMTCNSSFSSSKSGYNSGSTTFSQTGSNPSYTSSFTWSPSNGFNGASMESASSASGTCSSCVNCQGNAGNPALSYGLVSRLPSTQGGNCYYTSNISCARDNSAGSGTFNNGDVITTPTNTSFKTLPTGGSLTMSNIGYWGSNAILSGNAVQAYSNPGTLSPSSGSYSLTYTVSGTNAVGGTCSWSSAVNLTGSYPYSTPISFSVYCANGNNFTNNPPFNMNLTVKFNGDNSTYGSVNYTIN